MKISVFWFRRDLRLNDNKALEEAIKSGMPILPVFIFDELILNELPKDDARVSFIYQNLEKLNKELIKYGSSLLCLKGKPTEIWQQLTSKFEIESVFLNRDYEPYAIRRDNEIKAYLSEKGIGFFTFKDQVIFEENEILKEDGNPYTVFTPYKNKWLKKFNSRELKSNKLKDVSSFHQINIPFPSLKELGFVASHIKVRDYDLSAVDQYSEVRNFPAMDKTSYLSPHLRFGTVSIREVLLQFNLENESFLSELIWREFFMQILFHFPHVVQDNFKAKYDGIKWNQNEDDFKKWCEGKTGYPIVDAGMRQLNESGYMHNRVRMITAGFLCKHLLIDWRWGEAYFAMKLLDYELSSNNGNWQWAAGTGCDSAPYFRIFNPMEQVKKFDKELKYINTWVKDLNSFDYPEPMIEHKFARKRALEAYKIGLSDRF